MQCFSPLVAYRGGLTSTGKRSIVFNRRESGGGKELKLPCGQCCGCRLERSRQWAVRCMHEASLYDQNCFLTLTYDSDHLPFGGTLVKSDFQNFMKRLRDRFGPGIRFYMCGEYGEQLERPHYHALLFNFDFEDKVEVSSSSGSKIYVSEDLKSLWPFGFSSIGSVTFESAAYVARYVMKKITGASAADHYGDRIPEYTTMSRRGGIGKSWFEKFKKDVFPSDEVVVRGFPCKPPRYYDNLLDKIDSEMYASIKAAREKASKKTYELTVRGEKVVVDDNDCFRLKVKEICAEAQISKLVRPMEASQ